jgi:uncharacterized membrane protein
MAQQLDGKRPLTPLAGPYGHPFHPVLITIPIGAWVASLVFDIASHLVDDPGFLTQASEWLIAIGVLGALAAAIFGLMDLLAIPKGTRAFTTGRIHAGLNLAVTVAYVLNFVWRHNDYTQGDAVSGGPLLLSVVSLLVLSASGWLGGKLSYHYGVRVADEATQAEGFTRKDGSGVAARPGTAATGRGRRP